MSFIDTLGAGHLQRRQAESQRIVHRRAATTRRRTRTRGAEGRHIQCVLRDNQQTHLQHAQQ